MTSISKKAFFICFLSLNLINLNPNSQVNPLIDPYFNFDLNYENIGSLNFGDSLGIKIAPPNSNIGILIGFRSDNNKTGFIIVGENQKFYNFNNIYNTMSKIAFGKTLSEYPKIIKPSEVYAKDLVIGDRLQASRFSVFNVMRIERISLNKEHSFYKLINQDNYVFWDLNLKPNIFGPKINLLNSFIVEISTLIPIAVTASIIKKSIDKLLKNESSKSFSHYFFKYMAIEFATIIGLELSTMIFPEESGSIISKNQILSRLFASLGIYPVDYSMFPDNNEFHTNLIESSLDFEKMKSNKVDIHFGTIDFVDEEEVTNLNSELNSTSEILVRTDGTLVNGRNKTVARLSITKLIGN